MEQAATALQPLGVDAILLNCAPPLDTLAGLRTAPLLAGCGGLAPVFVQAVARAAVALGRFAAANATSIASIDVNPLIAGAQGEGAWAVDAVVEPTGVAHGQ
jgi:hypothetical protein